MNRRLLLGLAAIAALVVVLAACQPEAEDDSDTASDDTDEAATEGAESADDAAQPIAQHCPDPIILQANWLPQPEHYPFYQFAGTGGEVNAEDGVYTNHRDDLGVGVEVRMGGPKAGFQPTESLLYQDFEILLAMLTTSDIMGSAEDQPVTGVATYLSKSPAGLVYDPETYDFESMEDVREEGALVIHREGASYMEYLLGAGVLDPEQTDASYDGSPSRFIAEDGEILQQGFITSEPYVLENEVEEWGRPVDYLLAFDAGYESYYHLVARPDTMEEQRTCLEHLVPELQRAMLEYRDDPEPVNEQLLEIADALGGESELNQGRIDYAMSVLEDEDMYAVESDGVWGSHDMERIERMLEKMGPVVEEQHGADLTGVGPDDIATNEFINPDVTE